MRRRPVRCPTWAIRIERWKVMRADWRRRKNTIRQNDGSAKSHWSAEVGRFRSKTLSRWYEIHDFLFEDTIHVSNVSIWMWPTMKPYRITTSKSPSKIWIQMRMTRGDRCRRRHHWIEPIVSSIPRLWTPTKWDTNARSCAADTSSVGYFDGCERYRAVGGNLVAKFVAEVNTLVFEDWRLANTANTHQLIAEFDQLLVTKPETKNHSLIRESVLFSLFFVWQECRQSRNNFDIWHRFFFRSFIFHSFCSAQYIRGI